MAKKDKLRNQTKVIIQIYYKKFNGINFIDFRFRMMGFILHNSYNLKHMKGNQAKKPIFIQIGKHLASSKPHTKRQSNSFASNHITSAPIGPNINPSVNQTQPLLPNRRKISQASSSINKTYAVVSNINDDFLFMRKQNYLNTKFNIRKNKLKEITKENKQLYERLNSQKSCYSSTDLNKSFQQNNQIKKRLSQSKLSQRLNSSRSSSRSKIESSKGIRLQKKKDIKIAIKATSINDTQNKDLRGFKGLFNQGISSSKNQQKSQKQSTSFKSYRVNQVYSRSFKTPVRKSIQHFATDAPTEGGLLHRIAQQMIDNKGKGGQKKKAFFSKSLKPLNF